MTLAFALAFVVTPAFAGFNAASFLQSIPALDEIGLGVLIALVAGVAGWALRRRGRRCALSGRSR